VWGGAVGFLHFPSSTVIHEYAVEMSSFFTIRRTEGSIIGKIRAKQPCMLSASSYGIPKEDVRDLGLHGFMKAKSQKWVL
jgi:hypothetical protein